MAFEIKKTSAEIVPASQSVETRLSEAVGSPVEVSHEAPPAERDAASRASVEQASGSAPALAASQKPAPATTTPASQEIEKKISKILEEDVKELYLELPEKTKAMFRKKGEETAVKIRQLIETTKATALKVIELLRVWLRLLPGAGSLFLEQLIKIKTDKILDLAGATHAVVV